MTFANSQFPNFLLFNKLGGQKLDWYKVCNFGQLNGSKGKYIGSVRSAGTPAFWGAKKTSPHYNHNHQQKGPSWKHHDQPQPEAKRTFLETPRPTTTISKKDLPGNTTTNHNHNQKQTTHLYHLVDFNDLLNHRQTPKHLTTHLQKFSPKPL